MTRQAWRDLYGQEPTDNQVLYAQAIAYLETGYGRAGQFGSLASQGLYNWGALETRRSADGSCPAGTAPGSDQGSVCFYVYDSDEKAAKAFLHTLTQTHWPGVISAMSGSPEDVATAMRQPPPYYAGLPNQTEAQKITAYANGIRNAIKAIGANAPTPNVLSPSSSTILTWLAVGGAVYGAWWWYQRHGLPSFARKPLRTLRTVW